MIRSKGEAGTGDIVEAVRHLRTIVGEIRAPRHARRRRAGDGGQGARRAARPRAPRRGRGPAARRHVLRRRHRDAGRRRARDAPRRRGRLRRLGHLQERGPGGARRRGRRGDDALPGLGPRAQGLRGARRRDAVARGAQARRDARSSPTAAGERVAPRA